METLVIDHPLVAHKLTRLRDEDTSSATFRLLAEELVTLLAYEATDGLIVEPVQVAAPVGPASGVTLAEPKPLVVPILRAGLGMLNGMVKLMPTAEVGFLGMVRDETSLIASTYADRIAAGPVQPAGLRPGSDAGDRWDPGCRDRPAAGARRPGCDGDLPTRSPEGIERVASAYAEREVGVRVVTACIDTCLNDRGYVVQQYVTNGFSVQLRIARRRN
jgi:uracil phosphoribosyltransferase